MENSERVNTSEYSKSYSDKRFFEKVGKVAKKAGIQVIYSGLLLYYTLQKPKVPKWAKRIIVGALGYFIFPLDLITDLVPGVGYVDDLGVIVLAIGAVAFYIDKDTKNRAKEKLRDWFGSYDDKMIDIIDYKITK